MRMLVWRARQTLSQAISLGPHAVRIAVSAACQCARSCANTACKALRMIAHGIAVAAIHTSVIAGVYAATQGWHIHSGKHMTDDTAKLSGPDFSQAVELSTIADGTTLLGHADGEPVLLTRRGDEVFAIGAICTHYGAPLAQGLIVGDTVRCPWHHACFDLRTGEMYRAPALDAVACDRVHAVRDAARMSEPGDVAVGAVYVHGKLENGTYEPCTVSSTDPESVTIIGGGAAGNAAAEALRNADYCGPITILSADQTRPCDRPNLSKGYLAGTATDDSNLLRPADFYTTHKIDLQLGVRVTSIDTKAKTIDVEGGSPQAYDVLLLATGAAPRHLDIPGCDLPHVHYLRTLSDARALVAGAATAKRAVVIGASFIGLEVASSLRTRGIDVHVVGTETTLMAKILGRQVGDFLRALHEQHGVTFHLGTTATAIDERSVMLGTGERLQADLIVIGIGVIPATALAEQAGLAVDHGVLVDAYLRTNAADVFAAGDIASWPDRLSGKRIRVEHWVVAERQGQTAAHNILGQQERFDHVPFFWTEQYDLGLAYVGHAERWDEIGIDGSLEARDCTITYRLAGQELAKAFIHRDLAGLHTELAMEQRIAASPVELAHA